jgi:hypothetical protein
VAFDPTNNRYLVVWREMGADENIRGQLVNADGTLSGTVFNITTALGDQIDPRVSFDPLKNRFLVVWENSSDGSIRGQLLNANGTPNGLELTISSAGQEANPSITFDVINDRYLVAWDRFVDGTVREDIYGRYVNADGSTPAASFLIANSPNVVQLYPAVSANFFCGNVLTAFTVTDAGFSSLDIALTTVGSCTPDPGLAWVTGETNGVNPDSGPSGTSFIFKVDYFSASNNPPQTNELRIDLNADGVYGMGVITLLPGGNFPPLSRVLLFAVPGLILLTILLFVHIPRKHPVLSVLGISFTILLVSLAVVTGCETGGGGDESDEIITMSEVDTGDTVFTDGKTYTASLDIDGDPRTIKYRFVFSDGIKTAQLYGATELDFRITP